MGQKINPLGFRLGTTQSHHSLWFAKPNNYSKELQKDEQIRDYIKNYIQKNMTSSVIALIRIEIEKYVDLTDIFISIIPARDDVFKKHYWQESKNLQPNLQKKFASVNEKYDLKTLTRIYYRQKSKNLQLNLEKKIDSVNEKYNRKTPKRIYVLPKMNLTLKVIKKNHYSHPKILAEFISAQLLARIPFRKTMKTAIELAKQANTKGIRVQIAGRIGGNEIARVEWIRDGRVPLQTIQAKIDYCCYPIRTIYGVLGIKIWIFIEENNKPFSSLLFGETIKKEKPISSFSSESKK
uniref:ribosomal protein S3 n=1 Tax=Asyneuma japonicum TaxID=103993 RepID=UPI002E763FCA|nr:ribosomal protein S3 [Asyneuma japonicum]WPV76220.1 ribosomal protein S3 [Asyneuma japonicum]